MAVPLVDVDGRVWAVLAVQELPFYALTQENLALYALMAGALADTLEFGANVKSYDAKCTQRFEQRVRRCLVDARRHGVPASLVRVLGQQRRPGQRAAAPGAGGAAGHRRGLPGADPRRRACGCSCCCR